MKPNKKSIAAKYISIMFLSITLAACTPEQQTNIMQGTQNIQSHQGSSTANNSNVAAELPDPALQMQKLVFYYSSPWSELAHLDSGSDNYKKLAGTLARIQTVAARNPDARNQLPVVLINGKNECIDIRSVGLYKHSCQTIKIDYSDEEVSYEFPIEIEAVLSHEWGHHLARTSRLEVSPTEHEIVADCFAGVVFGYYVKNNLISTDEGLKALQMMAQLSNNSEGGIHPNMENRTSAFLGGLAQIAEPAGEYRELYPRYCASLERILDTAKVRSLGLSWKG